MSGSRYRTSSFGTCSSARLVAQLRGCDRSDPVPQSHVRYQVPTSPTKPCPVAGTGRGSKEQFAVQLRSPLRAAADEAHDGVSDRHVVRAALDVEDLRER